MRGSTIANVRELAIIREYLQITTVARGWGIGEQATKPRITELETYTIDASIGKWIDVDCRRGSAVTESICILPSMMETIDVGAVLVTLVSRSPIDNRSSNSPARAQHAVRANRNVFARYYERRLAPTDANYFITLPGPRRGPHLHRARAEFESIVLHDRRGGRRTLVRSIRMQL